MFCRGWARTHVQIFVFPVLDFNSTEEALEPHTCFGAFFVEGLFLFFFFDVRFNKSHFALGSTVPRLLRKTLPANGSSRARLGPGRRPRQEHTEGIYSRNFTQNLQELQVAGFFFCFFFPLSWDGFQDFFVRFFSLLPKGLLETGFHANADGSWSRDLARDIQKALSWEAADGQTAPWRNVPKLKYFPGIVEKSQRF